MMGCVRHAIDAYYQACSLGSGAEYLARMGERIVHNLAAVVRRPTIEARGVRGHFFGRLRQK